MSKPPSTTTRPSSRSNARRPSAGARPARGAAAPANRGPWLIAAVVVVIGLAALIAVFVSRDSGNDAATGSVQNAPVLITGTALAAADGTGLIDPATDPAVGKTVPTMSGSTPSGQQINYTPTGKPTVYVFVAHWCPHCQAELPRIKTWIDEGRFTSSDVVWRTVSTGVDSGADNYPPSSWFSKIGWTQPVLVDSAKREAATAFGLRSFPYMLFVDGNGVIKQRATGELTLDQLTTGIKAITG
jgi:thiol-disulfide isomerase/thioredoxin